MRHSKVCSLSTQPLNPPEPGLRVGSWHEPGRARLSTGPLQTREPTVTAPIRFIFAGPPNAGKTTAIAAISEIEPINTDVVATDELAATKAQTTVAMDYGRITLDDGQIIGLYGTPGQRRFDFMWDLLTEGGLGLILLVNNTDPDPVAALGEYLEGFQDFIEQTGVVIGITAMDLQSEPPLEVYARSLAERGLSHPIFPVDVRRRDDVLLLIDTLLLGLEA